MDNENLVLKIKHDNWGEIGPNAWQGTEWKIYGDLRMEVFLTINFGDRKKKQTKISQKDFDHILSLIKQSEKDDKKVEALDGSVWEIKRYQGKTLTWERKIGYIYGIKSLEALAGVLYKLASLKQIKW